MHKAQEQRKANQVPIFARHIHTQGKRADEPFVAVDCGSLSPTLAQSAFFGHVKGAFTGADTNRAGYFQEAEGGTLLLDEVGNLTMETQQMLLRAIQERCYRPIGAKEDKTADVRIVAATNEDLEKAVREKRFRQDLLYRLQEFVITVPPLRDSQEDILPLAEFFREIANQELERDIKGFDASARKALLTHAWPGNVRELKQKIQSAVLQAEGDMIIEDDLELYTKDQPVSTVFALKDTEQERERIRRALEQANGNRSIAARLLGIGRSTLYRKMLDYGMLLPQQNIFCLDAKVLQTIFHYSDFYCYLCIKTSDRYSNSQQSAATNTVAKSLPNFLPFFRIHCF